MRSFKLTFALFAAVALLACAAAPKPVARQPYTRAQTPPASIPDVTADAAAMLAGPSISEMSVSFVTPAGWTEARHGIDGFGHYTIWVESEMLNAHAVLTIYKTADYTIDSGNLAVLQSLCEEFKNSVVEDGYLVSGVTVSKRRNACSGTYAETNGQGYYRVTTVPNQSRFLTEISAGHADVADTRAVAEAMTMFADSVNITGLEEAR